MDCLVLMAVKISSLPSVAMTVENGIHIHFVSLYENVSENQDGLKEFSPEGRCCVKGHTARN